MVELQENTTMKDIIKKMISFSLPLIFSGILQQLYNWVDAFILGRFEGDIALGAIGETNSPISFYILTMTGFAIGLAVLFGQKFGSKQLEDIPKILTAFTIILAVFYAVVAIVGIIYIGEILTLLKTTKETFMMAETYLKIILIGIPFLSIYNVFSSALKGIGDTKTPFYAIVISSILNVILDVVFIILLRKGIQGAAIGTIISQISMTIFIVIYTFMRYPNLRPVNLKTAFMSDILSTGCKFGLPPMIQSSVTAVGNLILQSFMNGFGTTTVIAITSAYRVDTLALLPIINLGSAISTLTAQSYGAKHMNTAKNILRAGTYLMIVVSVILTFIIVPSGGYLIKFFGAGDEAVQIGKDFFIRLASFYVVFGLMNSTRGFLEGIGDITFSSVVMILTLIVRIGMSYALVGFFDNMVIAYAEAIAWVFGLILLIIRTIIKKRNLVKYSV